MQTLRRSQIDSVAFEVSAPGFHSTNALTAISEPRINRYEGRRDA